jgi:hypothetical protein
MTRQGGKVRKLIVTAALAAAAAWPAAALGQTSPTPTASQLCRAQRAAIGASAFAQLYGTNADRSNAFGTCVSKVARAQRSGRSAANSACRAERAADAAAFAAKYGTGKNKRNAFGRCVSTKAQAAATAAQNATINAARTCRTERTTLGATAFADKYGTNANKRNAFGRCVSQKVSQAG